MQGERAEVVRKGSIRNIELRLDDRVGGRKHATKVSHVESFARDPEELAVALQRKFQVCFAPVGKWKGCKDTFCSKRFLSNESSLSPCKLCDL